MQSKGRFASMLCIFAQLVVLRARRIPIPDRERSSTPASTTIACPNCASPLQLVPQLVGCRIRCLTCGTELAIVAKRLRGEGGPPNLAARMVAAERPCPQCGNRLRLVPQLKGKRIRCKACRGVFDVATRPWQLTSVKQSAPPRPRKTTTKAGLSNDRSADVVSDTLSQGCRHRPRAAGPSGRTSINAGRSAAAANGVVAGGIMTRRNGKPPPVSPKREPSAASPKDLSGLIPATHLLPRRSRWRDLLAKLRGVWAKRAAGRAAPIATTAASVAAPAIPPPVAKESPKPAKRQPKSDEPRPSLHAQGGSVSSAAGAWLVLLLLAALALGSLSFGGWWLLSGQPVHRQAHYLPERCDCFVSLRWSELTADGQADKRTGLPLPGMVGRCTVFLRNAGLSVKDVERINVGRSADGAGTIVVYRLTHPIKPEDVTSKPTFAALRKLAKGKRRDPDESLCLLETTAIAFPEPQTIVNGETELVRQVVHRRHRFSDPMNLLVHGLDFNATQAVATVEIPPAVRDTALAGHTELTLQVMGTTVERRYGPTLQFARTFLCRDEAAAVTLQHALQDWTHQAAGEVHRPLSVRQAFSTLEVSVVEKRVQWRLNLHAAQYVGPVCEAVDPLF